MYLIIVLFLLQNEVYAKNIITCYWNSWSTYRMGHGKFNVKAIDPNLCTHLIYNTAAIGDNDEVTPADHWNDLEDGGGKGNYKKFNDLRKENENLKTILAVGGWNTGSVKFSKMAADPTKRRKFIETAIKLVKTHKFDGMNLNWQFPTRRGGVPGDKKNLALLLQELYTECRSNGLLLTMDMSASPNIISDGYDIPTITKNIDYIHVTAFDYWGYWEPTTGLTAALFPRPNDKDDRLNIQYTVKYLISLGADASKLIIIVSAIGNTWTLDDPSDTSIGAKATRPGKKGSYTQHPGILAYYEEHKFKLVFGILDAKHGICGAEDENDNGILCEKIMEEDWTVVRDPIAKVPYAYLGDQWVGYDDPESIREKSKYVQNQNLAGIGLHSLDSDDFHDLCDDGEFPLLAALKGV